MNSGTVNLQFTGLIENKESLVFRPHLCKIYRLNWSNQCGNMDYE